MSPLYHLLLLLYFPLFSLDSPTIFASADPIYNHFVSCLTSNGVPSSQISQSLYSPTNASFSSVLNARVRNLRYNTSSTSKPALIVTPLQVREAQATVLCTKGTGLVLKIRSGGHDYEGLSYVSNHTFIILDMFNLRNISIDIPSQTAWVQAGATLGELYYSIWQKSNVFGYPAGVCPTVGVGGHISGGGYGPMLRQFGLTVDNVIDAQIIDVNGTLLTRAGMGEDVFWAIRGGGAESFGVVLAYQIRLVPVPQIVTVFSVERTEAQNAKNILVKWQNICTTIDNNLFIRVLVQPITENSKKTIRLTFRALFLGESNQLLTLMHAQFPELGLTSSDCTQMSWIESMVYWADFKNGATNPEALLNRNPESVEFLKRKSDYVLTPISAGALTLIFNKMVQLGKVGFDFNPYGGRMSQINETATPFPHRAGILYKIQYSVNWESPDPNLTQEYLAEARELYSFMAPYVSSNPRQAFLNYRDLDIGTSTFGSSNSYNEGEVYGLKYFKNNFYRLVNVKTAFDPQNFFWNEQTIPVGPS